MGLNENTEDIVSRLEKRSNKLRNILLVCIGLVFLLTVFYFVYSFFNYDVYSDSVLNLGSSIDGVYLGENDSSLGVKLSSVANLENVSGVKFVLKKGNKEYVYETDEGINELSYSMNVPLWKKLLGVKPDSTYYDYNFNLSDFPNLSSFRDIDSVGVYFEYENVDEAVEFDSEPLVYNPVEEKKSSTSSGGGGGSSSSSGGGGGGSSGSTTTCTPSCSGKRCGSDGCSGTCGGCNSANETCSNYVCVRNCKTSDAAGCLADGLFCSANTPYNCVLDNRDGCYHRANATTCVTGQTCVADQGCVELPSCTTNSDCSSLNGACGRGVCNTVSHNCEISYNSSSTICRASSGVCDSAERCTGASLSCPTNSYVADSTACTTDGIICTNDICSSGVCTHPNWVYGTSCTADSITCTNDICSSGNCLHVANNSLCSGGQTCSVSGGCVGGEEPDEELMGWELDETNTGLRGDYSHLTELTDFTGIGYVYGSLAITASNIVISDKLISHWIEVQGTNVTFLRCLVKPPSVNTGMPLIGGSNYNFIDSELDASLIATENVAAGLSLAGGGSILRSNLHHMSTGIQLYNSAGKTMLVENNYIHGSRYASGAHIDGLTIRQATGTSVTIKNNRISINYPCTAAIFYQAQSSINNVITEGNLLESPDYNLVLAYNAAGYGNNMQVINNRFRNFAVSGGPAYGYVSSDGPGWSAWSENYVYDSSAEDGKGMQIDSSGAEIVDEELMGWELDEINTGLAGVGLTEDDLTLLDYSGIGYLNSGTIYITASNIEITEKIINRPVEIVGSNVTFRRCSFHPENAGYVMVSQQGANGKFFDCDFNWDSISIDAIYMSIGIVIEDGEIYRCNIHGSSTGISIINTVSSMVSVAEGNYIHNLRYKEPAHIDGITVHQSAGLGTIIKNNRVVVTPSVATGPLFIFPYQGFIDNVLVEGNLLEGYGSSLILESRGGQYGWNMHAINNRLNPYQAGWYRYVDNSNQPAGGPYHWATWSEMYAYDSGAVDGKGAVISAP